MSKTETTTDRAPFAVRAAVGGVVALLAGGAVALMVINGPAVLIDLAVSAAAFVCM